MRLRFLAIMCMCFAHMNVVAASMVNEAWSPILVVCYLAVDGLSRISAPLLGLLSGYFAWRNLATASVGNFLIGKARSLLVPALLWNIAFAAFFVALALYFHNDYFIERLEPLYPDRFLGLVSEPLNTPLHYLTDLFKCMILLSTTHALSSFVPSRRAVVSLLICTGICGYLLIIGLFSIGDVASTSPKAPFGRLYVRPDLFLFFFCGAALAAAGWRVDDARDLFRLRVGWSHIAVLTVAFCSTALTHRMLRGGDMPLAVRIGGEAANLVCRLSGAAIFAFLAFRSVQGTFGSMISDRLSFRIFCSHLIVFFLVTDRLRALGVDPARDFSDSLIHILALPAAALVFAAITLAAERWWRLMLPGIRLARHDAGRRR